MVPEQPKEVKSFFTSAWNWVGIVTTVIGLVYMPEWWPVLIVIVPVLALLSRYRNALRRISQLEDEVQELTMQLWNQSIEFEAEKTALNARRGYDETPCKAGEGEGLTVGRLAALYCRGPASLRRVRAG